MALMYTTTKKLSTSMCTCVHVITGINMQTQLNYNIYYMVDEVIMIIIPKHVQNFPSIKSRTYICTCSDKHTCTCTY